MTSQQPTTAGSMIDIGPFRTGALWRHDGEVFVVTEVLLRETALVQHPQHRALQLDECGHPVVAVSMRLGRCQTRDESPELHDLSNVDGRQRLWLGHQAWLLEHATVDTATGAAGRDLTVRLRRAPEMDD